MSQPDSNSAKPTGVLVSKPKTSIYTVMLIVAASATLVGCLLLLLEIWQYDAIWNMPWRATVN